MNLTEGRVERIDFNPSHKNPLVVLVKNGHTHKLVQPRLTSTDLEKHDSIMRITQPGDLVSIELTSADYLSKFENLTLPKLFD